MKLLMVTLTGLMVTNTNWKNIIFHNYEKEVLVMWASFFYIQIILKCEKMLYIWRTEHTHALPQTTWFIHSIIITRFRDINCIVFKFLDRFLCWCNGNCFFTNHEPFFTFTSKKRILVLELSEKNLLVPPSFSYYFRDFRIDRILFIRRRKSNWTVFHCQLQCSR